MPYEECVEGQPNDVGGKSEHHHVDLDVLARHDQAVKGALPFRVGVGLSYILHHPVLGEFTLFLGEPAAVVRQVRENERCDDGDEHGYGTLNYSHRQLSSIPRIQYTLTPEEPAPGRMSQDPLHVRQHASPDERRESVGDEVSAEEDRISRGQLPAGVPLGQDEQGTGQKRRLDEADEEPNQHHSRKVLCVARERRDQAPDEHHGGNVERRPRDPVHEHVRRDLHQDVPDVEDAQARCVLRVVDVEIVLETLEPRGRDVISVEVVHDVDDHEQTAAGVQLPLQPLLDARSPCRVCSPSGPEILIRA